MTEPLLSLHEVGVRYGPIKALEGVSFTVASGSTTAVLGANGAGKTTLIRAIAGLVGHTGTISFRGSLLPRDPAHVTRAGVGHVPEGRRIFSHLTVMENLRLGGVSCGRHIRNEGIERAITLFPVLGTRTNQRAGTMSGGEQQMIAIGRALVAGPELLLMDEPTLGLAPLLIHEIYESIGVIRRAGTTVLIVEQQVIRARSFADRALLIRNGRQLALGEPLDVLTDAALSAAYLS